MAISLKEQLSSEQQKTRVSRKCPRCHCDIFYKGSLAKYLCKYAEELGSVCKVCSNSGKNNPHFGKNHSLGVRRKLSTIVKERYKNPDNLKKMAEAVKVAMHRPEVRKKHIEALHHSQWLKVRTDKGQLELLNKWNILGFKFIPNYQLHTDNFLCYIDGYDPDHNVVLEFDSHYHRKLSQQKKDVERGQKIVEILNPRKFWRYNLHTQSFTQTIGN